MDVAALQTPAISQMGPGSPPAAPGTADHAAGMAPPLPEPLQPVLALLTQGLNVHSTRLDALARAVTRLERGAVEQAEAAEAARAEAERRASDAHARAEAAEENAAAAIKAVEERGLAAQVLLERRIAELEARFEAVPPAVEELRTRYAEHEQARSEHERALAALTEQQSALTTRVDGCAEAAALASAEESNAAVHAALREEVAEGAARQRRLTMQTNALQEAHAQMHGLLSETQASVSSLQKNATDAAGEREQTREHVRELRASHQGLSTAQEQLADTVQLGLARAVATAEATRDDSEKVSSALAELEGWSRRLERLETDLSAAERRVDGAADEMRRQATSLEASQRNSMLQATQQVALHVKALSGDLLREMSNKASITDTQSLFDAMHKQFLSLREAHKALVAHVEAQGAAAETVADEAAAAALQAQGALQSSERLREETQSWLQGQLEERPTKGELEGLVSRMSLGGGMMGGMMGDAPPPPSLHQRPSDVAVTPGGPPGAAATPGTAAGASMLPAMLPSTPLGAILAHVRDLFHLPLQSRVEALEVHRLSKQADYERVRDELRAELGGGAERRQLDALQATLSAHVQKLPVAASYPHGRWTWTRGKLRHAGGRGSHQLVPWTSEKLNSSPSTYSYVADRGHIEVLAAGMYVVQAALFIPGSPSVSISVNGNVVVRRTPGDRRVVDTTGLVAGSSLRDVLSLVPGSRVAVQVELPSHEFRHGPSTLHDAHGLLELKKLW